MRFLLESLTGREISLDRKTTINPRKRSISKIERVLRKRGKELPKQTLRPHPRQINQEGQKILEKELLTLLEPYNFWLRAIGHLEAMNVFIADRPTITWTNVVAIKAVYVWYAVSGGSKPKTARFVKKTDFRWSKIAGRRIPTPTRKYFP